MCETADSITNLGKSMTFFEISIFEKEIQKLNFRFSRNALPLHNVLGFFTFLFYIDLKLRETAGSDCKFNFAKAITRTRRNFYSSLRTIHSLVVLILFIVTLKNGKLQQQLRIQFALTSLHQKSVPF